MLVEKIKVSETVIVDKESIGRYRTFDELAKDYPDKTEREEKLKRMSNQEIDTLISHMRNTQGKIYLSSFKK